MIATKRPKDRPHRVTIDMSPNELEALERLAKILEMSKAQTIRQVVKDELERRETRKVKK